MNKKGILAFVVVVIIAVVVVLYGTNSELFTGQFGKRVLPGDLVKKSDESKERAVPSSKKQGDFDSSQAQKKQRSEAITGGETDPLVYSEEECAEVAVMLENEGGDPDSDDFADALLSRGFKLSAYDICSDFHPEVFE